MQLTKDQRTMGMVVSFLLIAMVIVISALGFAGQIGDEAPEGSKWYIVAALCGLLTGFFMPWPPRTYGTGMTKPCFPLVFWPH